jgi:integrase
LRVAKAKILEDAELDWVLKVTKRESGINAPRNIALLLVTFGTALAPGELGQLLVSDCIGPDGAFLSGDQPTTGKRKPLGSEVRAEIAFNGRKRPLYWNNKRIQHALDDYFADRLKRGLGVWKQATYRGLDPTSPLFLGRLSEGFTYRETAGGDGKVNRQYASISNLLNKLLKAAGVEGAVSARRTLAVKLHRKRATDIRVIAEILGISSLTNVRKMVEGDTARLSDLVRDIV